jgi:uncharacterized protein YecE (DUF72 family)
MAQKKKRVFIGTSGWHYADWRGPFYPEEARASEFLEYYSRRFDTAEINNSFYGMPETRMFREWKNSVPADFIFAVKGSRYITHMKKLRDTREAAARFVKRARELGGKLGPILFQLPPRWKANKERLRDFLKGLPKDTRYAFEFRDPSWFDDSIYRSLAERNAAFCIYDLGGRTSPLEVTSDFVYIRLHGPGGPYQGEYTGRRLKRWAGLISKWKKNRNVYCYFDNDQKGYAPKDAFKLKAMLRKG